jgi:hypothetical protein
MRTPHRFHPRLDRLEDRTCPALSFNLANGLLVVSGVPTGGAVSIQEASPGTFTVQDGAARRTFAPVSNLTVSLAYGNDAVDVNLGGYTFAGTISTVFAGGTNSLSVEHGTAGFLNVQGGYGANAIRLGDGATVFNVSRDTVVALAGNAVDTLAVANHVDLIGNLSVSNVTAVNLAAGSAIGLTAAFYPAYTGTAVVDAATVGGDVAFYGSYSAAGLDALTVNGVVSGNVIFSGPSVNYVGDTLAINANVNHNVAIAAGGVSDAVSVGYGVTIGGNLGVNLWGGNDRINVADGSTIAGGAQFNLGNGTRYVSFGAAVGNNTNVLVFAITGGIGNETVVFTAGATFRGQALVSLSSYSVNTVTFAAPKTFNTYAFSIDGGFGGYNTLNRYHTSGTRLYYRDFAIVRP